MDMSRHPEPPQRPQTEPHPETAQHPESATGDARRIEPAAGPLARPALLALGWVAVGAAAVGVALPVMPTTIFLLIALWAFSRSSPRFGNWIRKHRVFGPFVRDWESYGAIPTRAKWLAIVMMGGSLAWLALFTAAPPIAVALTAGMLTCVAIYIMSCPAPPARPTAGLSRQRVDRTDKFPTA